MGFIRSVQNRANTTRQASANWRLKLHFGSKNGGVRAHRARPERLRERIDQAAQLLDAVHTMAEERPPRCPDTIEGLALGTAGSADLLSVRAQTQGSKQLGAQGISEAKVETQVQRAKRLYKPAAKCR